MYFWPYTREIAIRSCKFTLSVLLGMNYSCEKLSYCSSKQNFYLARGSIVSSDCSVHLGLVFRAVESDILSVRSLE